MPKSAITNAVTVVAIQPVAVVSKVIYRDEELNVTVFGFDSGEGLTRAPCVAGTCGPGPCRALGRPGRR